MSVKFREHRGSLADSMETVVEVEDRGGLLAVMRERLAPYSFRFADEALTVEPYCHDERIGWDTHIVKIEGYGVAGFTDGPVPNPISSLMAF